MIKKFYFPLTVHVQERGCYDWSGEYTYHDGEYANLYKDAIERGLCGYCDEDMVEYFFEDRPVRSKLLSMFYNCESVNGCLYGRVDVDVSEELTSEEMEVVKDYICGQNSDGFGEGFEQHEIRVGYDEEIYVSFWNSSDDYWIYDEDEFNSKIRYNKNGGVNMDNKIIELTKRKNDHLCLICCKKQAAFKFKVVRPAHDDIVMSFHVCNDCLVQMQNDIQKTCE